MILLRRQVVVGRNGYAQRVPYFRGEPLTGLRAEGCRAAGTVAFLSAE
jgi:hypothetical protein